jgi:aminopeptidase N
MRRVILLALGCYFFSLPSSHAQLPAGEKEKFAHADTLRGSINPERAWWNVLYYDIQVTPDYEKKSIKGVTGIRLAALKAGTRFQLDLQTPLNIISIMWGNRSLSYKREGNAFHVSFPKEIKKGAIETITVKYEGVPRSAIRPPWDGGWIWTKDSKGRPWMSVACQGLGASVWYPCKDHQSDEPDSGASLHITVPDTLMAVGNGRLKGRKDNGNGTATYSWSVVNPINNYDIIPYIGKYVNFHRDIQGEKGVLDCSYWVLDYNLDTAQKQFRQADSMLHCFESWMGPYPFYEDGYKLVEAPHLGMEHQSAVAYGNHYANGYLGRDLSGTGWGLKWDFIIVHESGHEWFGNNITTNDLADMWVHEGFTNYTETLYTTCQDGVEAGNDYVIGTRKNIRNDKPVIGIYGVNNEGSGDMYYKGGNMLHMIRQIIGDSSFRGMLHGLTSTFHHKTVTSPEIEAYMMQYTKKDLSKIFFQYLRTTKIPVLEYKFNNSSMLSYHWSNCVEGFNMPVKVAVAGQAEQWIEPTTDWKTLNFGGAGASGDSTRVAADSMKVAGDSTKVAGDTRKAAGGATRVAGDSVRIAGDPVKMAGDSVKVAGDPTRMAGDSTKVASESSRMAAGTNGKDLTVDRNFYITVKKIN